MSFLRRRFAGGIKNDQQDDSSPDISPAVTPNPSRPSNLRVVTAEQLQTLKEVGRKGKSSKKKNAWIFILGGLAGIVAAAFFAGSNDMIDLSSLEGMNLDSILEALPAGFMKDAQMLTVRMSLGIPG